MLIRRIQEAKSLPDWGKMRFTKYPSKSWEEILPGVQSVERDLISKLVVYESGDRLSAEEVCYFSMGNTCDGWH